MQFVFLNPNTSALFLHFAKYAGRCTTTLYKVIYNIMYNITIYLTKYASNTNDISRCVSISSNRFVTH